MTNPDPASVFVVHGRNEPARRAVFEFLRSLSLKPTEWGQAVRDSGKGAPFIGEILDKAFERAQAVLVLLTGDDLAKLRPDLLREDDPDFEAEFTPQARPNVLFEAGMAFGRQSERTILLQLGSLRPFSDIAGRHCVHFKGDVASRQELATRLKAAGCPVDLDGTDWHSSGDFDEALAGTDVSLVNNEGAPDEPELQAEELQILEHLAKEEANFGSVLASADQIAADLKMPAPRAKHFVSELEDKELLAASYFINRPADYSLSRKGRAKLVALGII